MKLEETTLSRAVGPLQKQRSVSHGWSLNPLPSNPAPGQSLEGCLLVQREKDMVGEKSLPTCLYTHNTANQKPDLISLIL